MSKAPALSKLTTDAFLREIHHFLWLDPVWDENGPDQGWNCRDHAWVTALLAHSMGYRPVLFSGCSFIIGGPTNAHSGYGVYQPVHAWVGLSDIGHLDLSIKNEVSVEGEQRRLPIKCVLGRSALPADRARLIVTQDAEKFRQGATQLARQRKQLSLLYLIEAGEALTQRHVESAAQWINSPLSARLDATHGESTSLYCALFLHLHALVHGKAGSLASDDGNDPWLQLVPARADALEQTLALLQDAGPLAPAADPATMSGTEAAGADQTGATPQADQAPASQPGSGP